MLECEVEAEAEEGELPEELASTASGGLVLFKLIITLLHDEELGALFFSSVVDGRGGGGG